MNIAKHMPIKADVPYVLRSLIRKLHILIYGYIIPPTHNIYFIRNTAIKIVEIIQYKEDGTPLAEWLGLPVILFFPTKSLHMLIKTKRKVLNNQQKCSEALTKASYVKTYILLCGDIIY